ncbi:MAG: ribonuclease Y [bacterium]|nr:ribonuclease Y [bacterium]
MIAEIERVYQIFVLAALIAGMAFGYFYRKYIAKIKISSAEEMAAKIVDDARHAAESIKREKILEAKERIEKERAEFERDSRGRRIELQKLESRLLQREENLDKKLELLEKRGRELACSEEDVKRKREEIERLRQEEIQKLESLSEISREEAKKMLMDSLETEARYESSKLIRKIEDDAKATAEKKARNIISLAIQRLSSDQVQETTVSTVSLPNDEMKGRIIGREGRNIRALETLTGVDVIIDDTPGAVTLSGYDPIRREVARISLERLISDGRIHPARIEEMVAKVQKEIDDTILEEGEKLAFELGVHDIPKEAIPLLGKLKFRTSYGQNVLQHSREVAYIASIMASELHGNLSLVKRAGLLHDIGKAVDQEVEGPHAAIGADIAKRFNEQEVIVNAIAAHHGEVEPKSVEAVLIQAADAISAARPGARRESLEIYLKRLERLEKIAYSFREVEKAYAIQAGREIRVMVQSENVDDLRLRDLGCEIAKRIENELEYPGQIKVTVIRETRVVEYAK